MPLTEDDKAWISERLERVETRLSTEFHAAAIRALDVELESLTDRLKKLEEGSA